MAKYEIYKTTNLLNGIIYVGKDKRSRPGYLGSGTHLKRALLKYGKENFMKEIRRQTGKEVALKHFTPEEISRRSKKGWANLSPEDRAKRAKLMKTKKEVQNG